MKAIITPILFGLALTACGRPSSEAPAIDGALERADVVYTNGKVYTVNETLPWAEAVAIKDGEFIAVGTKEEIAAVTGDSTEVIDLGGKFVMPGIQDTHLHFESAYLAGMLEGRMLRFGPEHTTIEALQQALQEYADANPDLEVLFAEQLPLSMFPNNEPTRGFVDEILPDRPVVLYGDQEHEVVLNAAALELEGLTPDTPAPPNGFILKDPETGELTGMLKEAAAGKWGIKHMPALEREKHRQGLKAITEYLVSIGITAGKQQHAKPPVATAFNDLGEAGELPMRVALSWTWRGPLEPMPLEQQEQTVIERSRFAGDLIEVDFIKFSIDGVPGTTGYLLEPHESDGSNGNSFYNFDDLVADIAKFDAMGLGITFHCMGDAGTRQVLDALQAVRQSQGELKGRHQLGHASLVHPDDLPRLRQLNLTPEFSPVLWYPAPVTLGYGPALGDERLNRLWPMQSLHQAGARIVIATDGPLFWREPMETLEISVTRKEPGDTSGDALGAEESLDLATAIAGMTVNAAYLMNQEDRTGSIETGKFADMIVLDKNLFEIPEYEISTAGVLLTIVGGKVVFDAATDAGSEDSIEDEHGVELDLSGDASPHASEWSRVL